jgi:hypothetical protein
LPKAILGLFACKLKDILLAMGGGVGTQGCRWAYETEVGILTILPGSVGQTAFQLHYRVFK